MYSDFSEVIDERKQKQHKYETTFIGIKSSKLRMMFGNFLKICGVKIRLGI